MRFSSGTVLYVILLATALTLLGARAHADGLDGLFVGGSVGRAPIATNNALYQSQLEASASSAGELEFTKASLSKRDFAWWVDSGYMIWPYVGIEASYLRLGRVYNQVSGSFTPTGGTPESVYASTLLSSRGPALGLVFRLPLIEHLDIDFRLADYYARTSLSNTLIVNSHTFTATTSNGSSLMAGVGAAYTFGDHWSARLDFLRINQAGNSRTMKYDIDMASVGASYTF